MTQPASSEPGDDLPVLPEPRRSPRRRRRRVLAWIPLGLFVLAIAPLLSYPLFPAEEITGCTIEDPGYERARRNIMPNRPTDCGMFVGRKSVECTSDPGKELQLIPGLTYDLTVRGLRIPFLSSPKIQSATLSAEQTRVPAPIPTPDDAIEDEQLPEAVQELQAQFTPEALRAFDYEQPPYDPLCDPMRHVMTSIGLQSVAPNQAEQLLTPPPGTVAREPQLPCEGFWCEAPAAQ